MLHKLRKRSRLLRVLLKNHAPKVLLKSCGFSSAFLKPLFLTYLYRMRLTVFSVTLVPLPLRKCHPGSAGPDGSRLPRAFR